MSSKLKAAVKVLIQAIITALLVFAESVFLESCVSAGGDVNQTNDVTISVPNVTDIWTQRSQDE